MPKHSMKIHHARANPEYPARAGCAGRGYARFHARGFAGEHLRRLVDDLNPEMLCRSHPGGARRHLDKPGKAISHAPRSRRCRRSMSIRFRKLRSTSRSPIPRRASAARSNHGDTFIVIDSHGDIGASAGGPDGLFHHDTRYPLAPRTDRQRAAAAAARLEPARRQRAARRRSHQSGHLSPTSASCCRRTRCTSCAPIFLWRGTAYQRLGVRNYGDRAVDLRLAIAVRQRFRRSVRGARHAARTGAAS